MILLLIQFYIIWGIGWGLFCLSIAKAKNKTPQLWLVLGIFFSVIAFIVLMNLPGKIEYQKNEPICPFCNHKVGRNDKYCYECGELLKGTQIANFKNNYCSHCGKGLQIEYKFCPNCGRLLLPSKSHHLKMVNN